MDIGKFGFEVIGNEGESKFYQFKLSKDYSVNLTVALSTYTLDIVYSDGEESCIADRYQIDTQEELDFLILNSRVGFLFVNR